MTSPDAKMMVNRMLKTLYRTRYGIHDVVSLLLLPVKPNEAPKIWCVFETNAMRRVAIKFELDSSVIEYHIDGKKYAVNAFSSNPPFGTKLPSAVVETINELHETAWLVYKHAWEIKAAIE